MNAQVRDDTYRCSRCKTTKPLSDFYVSRTRNLGIHNECKECCAKKYADSQIVKRQNKQKELLDRIESNVKTCAKCNETKSKNEFTKSSQRKDGYKPYCKKCHNENNRDYRSRNPETSRLSSSIWIENNKDRREAYVRKWQENNRDRVNQLARDRRERNPDAVKEYQKKYSSIPSVRIRRAVSSRIRTCLILGKGGQRTFDVLGYSISELTLHLERQFLPGMSWDNYGKWHIDHILPVSSFSVESMGDEEFNACWALSNLRPLWAVDNMRKHASITCLV